MSEIENPACAGTQDGADSKVAGRDGGISNTPANPDQPSAIETVAALRKRLRGTGYLPIPVNGKVPPLLKWQEKVDTNDGEIDIWRKLYPGARSTGLLTRLMPTLDIDILDAAAAAAVEQMARDRFEDAGAVLVRVGNAPKRAIPFRTDIPFSFSLLNVQSS